MFQTLGFTGKRQINARASFFRYESGNAGGADESIRVRADGNDLGLFWPGDAVTLPVEVNTWDVEAVTSTTTGILRVGVGRVESARLVGNVQVIDGERNKVLSGVCFRGVGQTTGNQATVEVWNPVASGKNLFIRAVRAGSNSADSWGLQTSDFQLGTGGATPANLDRSSPASVALMRLGDATTLTSPKGLGAGFIAASTDVVVVLPQPVIVRPGFGCAFYLNSAANTLRATFEWEEWPV